MLLALPQAFGVQGVALIPFAWGLGFLALGLLGYETARAAEGVVSPTVAWLAGVLTLAFSANTWFAASGMEVVPLGWLLMRCCRRAAEWLEGERTRFWELLLLALLTPAMRPEGALGSLLIASALGFGGGQRRAYAALCLLFPVVPPLIYLCFTGHATQTTTLVKWLPFNPYFDARSLFAAIFYNLQLFWSTLLDGQLWSAAFVPEHSKFVTWLALPALIFAGQARSRSARSWLLVALGLGILLPTTYDSFLWNRLRYLWPFSWAMADWAGRIGRSDRGFCGAFVATRERAALPAERGDGRRTRRKVPVCIGRFGRKRARDFRAARSSSASGQSKRCPKLRASA